MSSDDTQMINSDSGELPFDDEYTSDELDTSDTDENEDGNNHASESEEDKTFAVTSRKTKPSSSLPPPLPPPDQPETKLHESILEGLPPSMKSYFTQLDIEVFAANLIMKSLILLEDKMAAIRVLNWVCQRLGVEASFDPPTQEQLRNKIRKRQSHIPDNQRNFAAHPMEDSSRDFIPAQSRLSRYDKL